MTTQPTTLLMDRPARALVLACGNTFRGDDGVGWRIGCAVEQRPPCGGLTVVLTQQLLPEHAEAISAADTVVFVDCSAVTPAGTVSTIALRPAERLPRILTQHLGPAALLRLALDLYARMPCPRRGHHRRWRVVCLDRSTQQNRAVRRAQGTGGSARRTVSGDRSSCHSRELILPH